MPDRAAPGDGLDRLRQHYAAYPYPPRDPADEARRLITGSPSHRAEIDHYCFAGARDWRAPFRALFAGGGTGDGLIMLASQLAAINAPAELVHLDLSGPARAVAEARAQARGLANIRFVTGSLLEIANVAPGPYDYIDCCGVLHHLPDPAAGLSALAAQLEPDGGMGVMLYGALGRTGVYPLQAALRGLGRGLDAGGRVRLARRLLGQLPATNWFTKNPYLGDHRGTDDAGLYDLLLHSCDRAYAVPEIAALLDGAGLAATVFIEPVRYDPANYLADRDLRERALALSPIERAALAENLSGALKTHVFYAVAKDGLDRAVARADGPQAVPVPREVKPAALAASLLKGVLKANFDGVAMRFPLPEDAASMAALFDGRRNLGDIQRALGLDWFATKARFDRLYAVLNGLNLLLLRAG